MVGVCLTILGCSGGGGWGGPAAPANGNGGGTPPVVTPPGGGSTNPPLQVPNVLSVSPKDKEAVPSGSIKITMVFDKLMDPNTFYDSLKYEPRSAADPFIKFNCEADCKTVSLTQALPFDFNTQYTFTLLAGANGIKDADGESLAAPFIWSFIVGEVSADPGFKNLAIDGGGIPDPVSQIPVADAGESTAIAVDSTGMVHITYFSNSDGAVKHAYCQASGQDCSLLGNWLKEIVSKGPDPNHKYGPDENMVIDQNDKLHISYRDTGGTPQGNLQSDGVFILKYATKNSAGHFDSVTVDDATDGLTNTNIKVGSDGRIHISYHATNQGANGKESALYYASCKPAPLASPPVDCQKAESWTLIKVDPGSSAGQPNSLFVTDDTVHISYYSDGTLQYATCPLSGPEGSCAPPGIFSLVDDTGDAGAENSLSVNSDGVHIIYRALDGSGQPALRYAFCPSGPAGCEGKDKWQTVTVDATSGVGRSAQLKMSGQSLHVVYRDEINEDLKYAFCPKECVIPEHWHSYLIDAIGKVGFDNYLALSPDGKTVYISYRDAGNAALKYAFGPAPNIN